MTEHHQHPLHHNIAKSTASSNIENQSSSSSSSSSVKQTDDKLNEDMSEEFLKQYNRLMEEGKEINPDEIKIQNIMKETISNPKTFHATRTQQQVLILIHPPLLSQPQPPQPPQHHQLQMVILVTAI